MVEVEGVSGLPPLWCSDVPYGHPSPRSPLNAIGAMMVIGVIAHERSKLRADLHAILITIRK